LTWKELGDVKQLLVPRWQAAPRQDGGGACPSVDFREAGGWDIRRIGTPVDYMAFRGLSEGRVDEIVFIEVETGRSSMLSDRERAVRRAVEERRVSFAVINVEEELDRLLQRLQSEPLFRVEEG
jgi:hypothetical protein